MDGFSRDLAFYAVFPVFTNFVCDRVSGEGACRLNVKGYGASVVLEISLYSSRLVKSKVLVDALLFSSCASTAFV